MDYKSYTYGAIVDETLPFNLRRNSVKIQENHLRITRNYTGPKLLGICRTQFYFTIYLIVYSVFLITGAVVFSLLETPGERALKGKVDGAINKFMNDNPTVTEQSLHDLIGEIVKATNRGISTSGPGNSSDIPNWTFGQSLFFSSTVVTTIGYGHVTPISKGGKLFCIIYATFGIPLTLVLLSALVERLLYPTIWLLRRLHKLLGHVCEPIRIRIIHLCIIVLLFGGLFLVLPAFVFTQIEPGWEFLDSFYYCFISLTTIGLGDYIPGDDSSTSYRPMYKILTTGYLFSGITFMMLTLAVFYDIPQLNLGLLFTEDEAEKTKPRKMRLISR